MFFKKYTLHKMFKFKSNRERYIVFVTLGCVIAFLGFTLAVRPFLASQSNIREEIPVKIKQLETYRQFIASKPRIERNLNQLQALSKKYFYKLLPGVTSPLAAASLQDILNNLAVKNLISIKSAKVLDIKGLDFFTQIPVQIEFITTITNLTNVLYDIENYQKTLIITDLTIQDASYRDPKDVRVAMVVAGLMRSPKNKD